MAKPDEIIDAAIETNIKVLRVDSEIHALFLACSEKTGASTEQVAAMAIRSYLDRSATGYHVENAHLIREVIALETRLEQLVLANLSLAETLYAMEGAGLRSFLQLVRLIKTETKGQSASVPAANGEAFE